MVIDKSVDLAAFRAHLNHLLASRDFASSRQLSEFLRFTSERAFAGCAQLEQEEIAAQVLGNADFVATYDSSVRKLASMTRHRLADYYRDAGASDPVIVTLPLRSYLPRYELRTLPVAVVEPSPSPPRLEAKKSGRSLWIWGSMLVLGVAGLMVGWKTGLFATASSSESRYAIATSRGDIAWQGADAAAENVLLGEKLDDGREFVSLLSFRPEYEAQQAGILIWQDADNYLRLGRRFTGRNTFEFGVERQAVNVTPEQNVVFDPEGQSGRPAWLSIRRSGDTFSASISFDGLSWRAIGVPIHVEGGLVNARVGIYAFHGRRSAPSEEAVFQHVSTGYTFATRHGVDWASQILSNCQAETQSDPWHSALSIKIRSRHSGCSSLLNTDLLTGPQWGVSTRIDFVNTPGVMSGLALRGSKGRIRLLRYDMNGPSIALMHDNRNLYSHKDFHGSPPLVLRLELNGGSIGASYSRDGESFKTFDQRVPLAEIGTGLQAGLILATSYSGEAAFEPAMRVFYVRKEAARLKPYR